MDIKGLRSLNLIGTILFCIIGIALISVQYFQLSYYRDVQSEIEEMINDPTISNNSRDSKYTLCIGLLILWLFIILIFTSLLYNYTVKGLDRGNFKAAKTWTLIGIIVGFAGGIIPLIIFIISYVSFDDAIRTQQYSQMQYGYQPYSIPIRYCIKCKRQIPPESRLCPYCGAHQDTMEQPSKKTPPPRLIRTTLNQNQKRK